jgi:hypothetical protein
MIRKNLWGEEIEVQTKLCSMCKQQVPIWDFAKEGSKGYLRYECRPCAKKQGKLVAKIKKTAPIIPDYHKCPICLRTSDELVTYGKNKKSVWVADHDHETEEFRGWLCHKCNLGLGNLGDDLNRCMRAAEYLKNNGNQQ